MISDRWENIKKWLLCLTAIAIVLFQMPDAFAQGFSGELKWLRINEIHTYYSEQGSEVESGGLDDLTITLAWPGAYSLQQKTMRSRCMWLGAKEFYDTVAGKTLTYKVVGVGPRDDEDQLNQVFLPEVFKLVGQFDHPIISVDGEIATINTLYDALDEVDESIPADRMLVVQNNTSIGVTVTKKAYAFTQQDHDNYFIHEYILKNTGIINANGGVHEQDLKDFVFCLGYRNTYAGESVRAYNDGWGVWNSSWGRNTIYDVVGTNPKADDFRFRAHLAWYGPHSERAVSDDWGCPNQLEDGILAAAKFGGVVTLYADKSTSNRTDDPYQPTTTHFIDSDADVCYGPYSQYDELYMNQRYATMTAGHAEQTMAEQVGDGFADLWGPGIGGSQEMNGYGPYELKSGDSIRIVVAECVAGISRAKNREVGANWLQWENATGRPVLVMPNGSETTDHNAYKEAWVLSCRDSLMQTFQNAVDNFNSGYNIPLPPPPPTEFTVTSGGDRIRLTWANNAASEPGFDGYVIYRSEGNVMDVKTVYRKIFECNAGNVVHEFDDVTAARGYDYYYYIQSKNDGSNNNGVPLASGMFWTLTSKPAYLRRPAGTALNLVRVVPNPYDIRARKTNGFEVNDSQYDRIAFYEIPPACKLRIFTERGDLIWEKEHNDGSGDELWDSFTSSRQMIASGIYILHVQVSEDTYASSDTYARQDIKDPKTKEIIYHKDDLLFKQGELMFKSGESVFRKFVVIR